MNQGRSTPTATRNPAPRGDLLLSAVLIELEQEKFSGRVAPYVDEEAFASLRKRSDLFAYRRANVPPEEQVLLVPLTDEAAGAESETAFICKQQLRLLARLIQQRLPDLLPQLTFSIAYALERRDRGTSRGAPRRASPAQRREACPRACC